MPLADYAHHNEDAARIWYEEEGRHPLPDPYDDFPPEEAYTDWPDPEDCTHDDGNFDPTRGYCGTCSEAVCPECKVFGDDEFEYESYPSFGNSDVIQRTCKSCDHTITWETEHTET